jgi:hypothetical protein
VFTALEWVFTSAWNGCSHPRGMGVHDPVAYAADQGRHGASVTGRRPGVETPQVEQLRMHARRPFVQALEVGDAAARPFIEGFQKIYRLEEEAKVRHLLAGERLEFRQEKSLPIMQMLRDRAQDLSSMPLLKPMRQGVTYLVNQWDKLVVPFDQDGRLEIDNGLAERRNCSTWCVWHRHVSTATMLA